MSIGYLELSILVFTVGAALSALIGLNVFFPLGDKTKSILVLLCLTVICGEILWVFTLGALAESYIDCEVKERICFHYGRQDASDITFLAILLWLVVFMTSIIVSGLVSLVFKITRDINQERQI